MGCYQLRGEVLRAKGLVLPQGPSMHGLIFFLTPRACCWVLCYARHDQLTPDPTNKISGRSGPLQVDARLRFLGTLLGLASGVLAGLFGTGTRCFLMICIHVCAEPLINTTTTQNTQIGPDTQSTHNTIPKRQAARP